MACFNSFFAHFPSAVRLADDQPESTAAPRPTITRAEISVETPQSQCSKCGSLGGMYLCTGSPSLAWRYRKSGLEIEVSLIEARQIDSKCLQATVRIQVGAEFHARAIYVSDPLVENLTARPYLLTMFSEMSKCGFRCPRQLKAVVTRTSSVRSRGGDAAAPQTKLNFKHQWEIVRRPAYSCTSRLMVACLFP